MKEGSGLWATETYTLYLETGKSQVVGAEAAAGGPFDIYVFEPAGSTEQVLGHQKLHRETLSWKKTMKHNKTKIRKQLSKLPHAIAVWKASTSQPWPLPFWPRSPPAPWSLPKCMILHSQLLYKSVQLLHNKHNGKEKISIEPPPFLGFQLGGT